MSSLLWTANVPFSPRLCTSPAPMFSSVPPPCPGHVRTLTFPVDAPRAVVLPCGLQGAPGSSLEHPPCLVLTCTPSAASHSNSPRDASPDCEHHTPSFVVLVLLLLTLSIVSPLWDVSFRTRTVEGLGMLLSGRSSASDAHGPTLHTAQPKQSH